MAVKVVMSQGKGGEYGKEEIVWGRGTESEMPAHKFLNLKVSLTYKHVWPSDQHQTTQPQFSWVKAAGGERKLKTEG